MNANEMTFGVEFEVLIPADNAVAAGGYHNGRQVAELPAGWNAQRDGSLSPPRGFQAVEIVSPILKGADGVAQVVKVCEWFKAIGAKVNASCGFHVHVGWNHGQAETARLVHYVANFEKGFYAASGTKSRETGTYCRPIKDNSNYVAKFKEKRAGVDVYSRYHVLNLTNLAGPQSKQTVEFRVFSGTTNATKAIGYIRLCLGIAEKALKVKKTPRWDIAPANGLKKDGTPWTPPRARKAGEGSTGLARLFACLGWSSGQFSDLDNQFGLAETPALSMAAVKAELVRLAAKYDSNAQDAD